jgi:hypothetical protein
LSSSQSANGKQRQQVWQHDQKRIRHVDPERRELKLQSGRRAEQKARQNGSTYCPFSEDTAAIAK